MCPIITAHGFLLSPQKIPESVKPYIYIYIIYLFQICKFLLTPTLITVNPCGCYRLFDEDYDNFESGGNDYNDDNSGDAGDY